MLDRFLDEWLIPGMLVGFLFIVIGGFTWVFYSIGQSQAEWQRESAVYWHGSTIYRICPDGTRIWRLNSGRFVDTWRNAVEDPHTICPSAK